jgi:hypothetical protein
MGCESGSPLALKEHREGRMIDALEEDSMLLPFVFCFVINHLTVSLAVVQMNAALVAFGLFAFIGFRLRVVARDRERRVAAALLIW